MRKRGITPSLPSSPLEVLPSLGDVFSQQAGSPKLSYSCGRWTPTSFRIGFIDNLRVHWDLASIRLGKIFPSVFCFWRRSWAVAEPRVGQAGPLEKNREKGLAGQAQEK
jgi:hypothetical protein